jgi:hypothetical protein
MELIDGAQPGKSAGRERNSAMPSEREKMEVWTETHLYDTIANNVSGAAYQSAKAELSRRRSVAQDRIDEAQIAAAAAQVKMASHSQKSLNAMRRSAWWTAASALATAASALATAAGVWMARH